MDLKKQGYNKDINDSLKSFKSKFINNDNDYHYLKISQSFIKFLFVQRDL